MNEHNLKQSKMGATKEDFIDMREQEFTYNSTFKVKGKAVVGLENYLKDNTNLIDYKRIADTERMYREDEAFKGLVKEKKKITRLIEDYIHKNGGNFK